MVTSLALLESLEMTFHSNIVSTQTLSEIFIDYVNGDLHLTSGADAIDMGVDSNITEWGNVTWDIDKENRPNGVAYDIGSDEF
jgi:hypothetical protein